MEFVALFLILWLVPLSLSNGGKSASLEYESVRNLHDLMKKSNRILQVSKIPVCSRMGEFSKGIEIGSGRVSTVYRVESKSDGKVYARKAYARCARKVGGGGSGWTQPPCNTNLLWSSAWRDFYFASELWALERLNSSSYFPSPVCRETGGSNQIVMSLAPGCTLSEALSGFVYINGFCVNMSDVNSVYQSADNVDHDDDENVDNEGFFDYSPFFKNITTRRGYGLKLLHALVEMHRLGVSHGDISDNNVIVTNDGDVRIIDFNSAFATKPLVISGTPCFASPELLYQRNISLKGGSNNSSSKSNNHRSNIFSSTDWWSFGAILFNLEYWAYHHEAIRDSLMEFPIDPTDFMSQPRPPTFLSPDAWDVLRNMLLVRNIRKRPTFCNYSQVAGHPFFHPNSFVNTESDVINAHDSEGGGGEYDDDDDDDEGEESFGESYESESGEDLEEIDPFCQSDSEEAEANIGNHDRGIPKDKLINQTEEAMVQLGEEKPEGESFNLFLKLLFIFGVLFVLLLTFLIFSMGNFFCLRTTSVCCYKEKHGDLEDVIPIY